MTEYEIQKQFDQNGTPKAVLHDYYDTDSQSVVFVNNAITAIYTAAQAKGFWVDKVSVTAYTAAGAPIVGVMTLIDATTAAVVGTVDLGGEVTKLGHLFSPAVGGVSILQGQILLPAALVGTEIIRVTATIRWDHGLQE